MANNWLSGFTPPMNGGVYVTTTYAASIFFSLIAGAMISFMFFSRSASSAAISNIAIAKITGGAGDLLLNEQMKMALVVRRDLKMGQGKIAAQCAHAAVGVIDEIYEAKAKEERKSGKQDASAAAAADTGGAAAAATLTTAGRHLTWLQAWRASGAAKVVLQVETEAELMAIFDAARKAELPCTYIRDAGRTQIAAGSKTVAAVGPAPVSRVDQVTGKLRLL
jgi:PTH2 family peptidyl-tRNA hydrolase